MVPKRLAPPPFRYLPRVPPESPSLRRDLKCITWDGVSYSFMVGVGETYVAAFALAVGLGEVVAGLVTTLPILAGSLLQLVTPRGVAWLGSNRRWVILCATVQSMSFLPLIVGAIVGSVPVWVLFLAVSLYWACNLGAGPAWNTWMTQIIPRPIRAKYFGWRTRPCQMGTLAGLALGGGVLAYAELGSWLPLSFAILFGLAALSRAISTLFLTAQSEPPRAIVEHRRVPPGELLGRARHGPDMRLLSYMLTTQIAVQISAAYFTPYMLKELDFSKLEYMGLISISFLAKSAAAPIMGSIAHRYGARRVLWIGGVGIVPLAALWMTTTSFSMLIAVQVLSGTMWAAYELATFLLMLETIREEERTSVLTTFNVANASAIAGGSLIGGAMLGAWEQSAAGYMLIFGVSSFLRLGSLLMLRRVTSDSAHPVPIIAGTMAVRPNVGSMDRPILGSIGASIDDAPQSPSSAATGPAEDEVRS